MKKLGRNELCHCGSGEKYKHCCLDYDKSQLQELGLHDITVFDKFSNIEDPRSNSGKKYRLIDLLIMTIYGLLCGQEDFENIGYFLKIHQKYFMKLLNIDRIPSPDCLLRLFAIINPEQFVELFVEWVEELVKNKDGLIISIDGKAIRDAHNKGESVPYIVSAFLSELKISIGEVKVKKKSNEKIAIPKLLDLINIKGATITMDAMGTTKKIAKKIIANGGHFVLKIKGNQANLQDEIKTYFDLENENKEIIKYETPYEKNHGRIEKGNITEDTHYFVTDTKIKVNYFIRALRAHWNIECSLHWILDVILNEDHSRNRIKNSLRNLSITRKIVYNLARLDNSFGEKIPLKRKLTQYNADFKNIENLIFNVIPAVC